MLLFRLADLPRRVRRLARPLPLDPTWTTPRGRVAPAVGWTLEPALISPRSRRLRSSIAAVIALYAEAEGRPRSAVEALAGRIEEEMGDYRLGRCIARTIEHSAYEFVSPTVSLSHEPAALRALCYRRAQEQYGGYVPRARRAAFMAALAADLDTTPAELEAALWADRAGVALLQRRTEPDVNGTPRPVEDLDPARVIARYNAAAVATVVAASSWVSVQVAATETAALKDLYRHAKALHVGVDVAPGPTKALLSFTLYGPGSRALVRSRTVMAGDAGAGNGALGDDVSDDALGGTGMGEDDNGDKGTAGGSSGDKGTAGSSSGGTGMDEGDSGATGDGVDTADAAMDAPGPGGVQSVAGAGVGDMGVRVPAAGGAPVAAVVTRLVQRHPTAVHGGWTRLLVPLAANNGPRLYHVPLEEEALAALRAEHDEAADAAADTLYDSAVEEAFARAYQVHEREGRGGLVRGWTLQREPRAVVVDGSVFLPDFTFRRGDVEVYGEVIGFYTEDYLARKRRKLVALRGRIRLLLIVERELAPVFTGLGFPLVTYRSGRQIAVADVVSALEQAFDPFARRRGRGRAVLARLCATEGPDISEEELSVATGCAGRSELLALWADVLAGAAVRRDPAAPESLRRVAEVPQPYVVDTARRDGAAGGGNRDGVGDTTNRSAGARTDLRQDGEDGADMRQGADDGAGMTMGAENGAGVVVGGEDEADRFPRRYLPGYGLVRSQTLAAAQRALLRLLYDAGGPVSLTEALTCLRQAGLPDPDEALLERLGAVVVRATLFGEAQVWPPGTAAEAAGMAAPPAGAAPPGGRRRRRTNVAAGSLSRNAPPPESSP